MNLEELVLNILYWFEPFSEPGVMEIFIYVAVAYGMLAFYIGTY